MIKLVAIDMDGTLLNREKQIPSDNIRAIRQAAQAGVKIVLCTGRMQSGVLPYFEQLDFAGRDEYAILNNGCSTYRTADWQLSSHVELTAEELQYLATLLEKYPNIALTCTDKQGYTVVADQVPELVAYDASLVFTKAHALNLEEAIARQPVFQVMLLGDSADLDTFQEAEGLLLSQHFSVVRSQSYILEILPQGVSKASALANLAKELGLSADEVMALGDADNDLEMIRYAGLGVAMGNANEKVKAEADAITGTCDEAGVAQALDQYVL